MRGSRIETPLEDVAVDHERPGNLPVSTSLLEGADVDEQGARVV